MSPAVKYWGAPPGLEPAEAGSVVGTDRDIVRLNEPRPRWQAAPRTQTESLDPGQKGPIRHAAAREMGGRGGGAGRGGGGRLCLHLTGAQRGPLNGALLTARIKSLIYSRQPAAVSHGNGKPAPEVAERNHFVPGLKVTGSAPRLCHFSHDSSLTLKAKSRPRPSLPFGLPADPSAEEFPRRRHRTIKLSGIRRQNSLRTAAQVGRWRRLTIAVSLALASHVAKYPEQHFLGTGGDEQGHKDQVKAHLCHQKGTSNRARKTAGC